MQHRLVACIARLCVECEHTQTDEKVSEYHRQYYYAEYERCMKCSGWDNVGACQREVCIFLVFTKRTKGLDLQVERTIVKRTPDTSVPILLH